MKFLKDIIQDIHVRHNLDIYITVVLAIIVAVLGIIGVANSIVISSTVLATLALVSTSLLQNRRENEEIRQTISQTQNLQERIDNFVKTNGNLAGQYANSTVQLNQELSSINRRLGLTLRFIHDPPKRSTGEVYRTACTMIEMAEKEILVLHYRRPRSLLERERQKNIETEAYQIERERFSQALLAKIKKHKKDKFFYRRVIQFSDDRDTKFTEENFGNRWFQHTKDILEILEDYPEAAYVKKAPAFLEQTYIIVDERYVFWVINGIDPDHKIQYMEGALFFDDPNQELVPYLKRLFERIDAHATIIKKVPEI